MAVVNKVHTYKYGFEFHHSRLAPYIVTHDYPYISIAVVDLRLAATYVGMIMCDNVGC